MKIQIKINRDNFDQDECDLIITDEGYENGYWGIEVDGHKFSVHGKELKDLFKAFLAL